MPSPTRAQIRRRRATALAGLAAVAVGVGVAVAGPGGGAPSPPRSAAGSAPARTTTGQVPERPPARAAVDRLDGLQQAGTTVVLRFAGTSPPAYVLRALRERRAAGVILFRDNLSTPAALRRLTRAVHRAAGPGGPGLVMVDQEGGDVRVVPWAGPATGQAQRTAADAASVAEAAGRGLRALGVDVALGPVVDVARPGSAFVGRAFSGDVGALGAATVRGWRDGGVLATAKHFPGLGAATANTDEEPATIGASRAELTARDLPPYRAAIAAGVPLVMASHALYPALDGRRIASQSRAVLTTLLRGELGFRGVVVTDSLEARAVTDRSSTPVAAVRSMAAGADLLLTTGKGSYLQVLRAVRARQRTDRAFAARVRQAAARVLALRPRRGPGG